jgi:hypothetical protein
MHSTRLFVALAGLVLVLSGCGKEAKMEVPQTYPVKGKLTDKTGAPLADAHIQFSPASGADNQLIINAVSDANGTFSLQTRHMNDAAGRLLREGAPEGEYKLTVMPKIEYDQLKGPPPTATWKPTTFKVQPSDNTVTVEVVITKR